MESKKNLFLGKVDLEIPPGDTRNRLVTVRFTYDINGILEVEATNLVGQKAREVIINSGIRMSEEELNQKIAQIKELKYVSRDEEKNQFLFARAERLYQESLGEEREVVMRNRQWLDSVINGKNQAAIHAAQKQVGQVFDYLEEKLGLGEL